MKNVIISINGKRFDVELLSRDAQTLIFTCNGQTFTSLVTPQSSPALVQDRSPSSVTAPSRPNAAPRPLNGEVLAPMPGIVVSIPIAIGQTIAAGDTVAVIEAMKMENNIRASHAGTVGEILVKSGDEVSHGQLLLKVASN